MAPDLRSAAEQPLDLAMQVMECRAYAQAKDAIDRAKKQEDIPQTEMVATVLEIQYELIREARLGKSG